jgi:hypothetical protein
MIEEWKQVPDYEMYEVSNLGGIRRWNVNGTKCKEILPTCWSNAPYYMFTVSKNRKSTKLYLHRVLATLFVPNDKPKKYKNVCFKDGNIANIELSNLYWSNQKERMGRRKAEGKYLSCTRNAKLTELDVLTIRWASHNKTMTHKELAKYFNVHPWTIYACVNRVTWKHIK